MNNRYIYTKLDEKTEMFKPREVCVHYPYLWTKECQQRYGNGSGSREACQGMGPVDSYPGLYNGFPVNFEYTEAGRSCGDNNSTKKTPGV